MKIVYLNEKGDSLEIKYSFPFFFQLVNGIDGLKNNITYSASYSQDGSSVVSARLEHRSIDITGVLRGATEGEINKSREKLLSVFNPKLNGQLIYETEDRKVMINCLVEEAPKFSKRNVWKQENFIVSLTCPEPFLEDIVETNAEISTWIGGWKFKFKLPFSLKKKGEPRQNVVNNGHVETPVEIIFYGPATNPKVTNKSTGEFIKIQKELLRGDILYIKTGFGNKKVEIEHNGLRENAFHYIDLDSTFFQLQVGDNLIEYSTDNEEDPQQVLIKYKNRFLGI